MSAGTRKRKKKGSALGGALVSLAVILLLGLGGVAAAGFAWTWYNRALIAPGPTSSAANDAEMLITIPRGASVPAIGSQLEAAGLISDARLLRIAARLQDVEGQFQAGEFAIPVGASLQQIVDILVDGKPVQHSISVIEGMTSAQIAAVVNASDLLVGDPVAVPPEGSVLPDTYKVTRGDNRAVVIERMQAAQRAVFAELWAGRAADLPFSTQEEAVILASVVQKEAAGPDEYAIVASVFVNRLRQGIRLQADATVAYGVSRGEPLLNRAGQRRTLYRSELDTPTPWNSYTNDGLPQTAIANPGRGAIAGVLNPASTEYLFFVADGSGRHKFAATYAEHNRNVAAYRRFEAGEIARERANDIPDPASSAPDSPSPELSASQPPAEPAP